MATVTLHPHGRAKQMKGKQAKMDHDINVVPHKV